jgi:hypothetical protein
MVTVLPSGELIDIEAFDLHFVAAVFFTRALSWCNDLHTEV